MSELSLSQLERYVLDYEEFKLDQEAMNKIRDSFDFLKQFSSDKIIYGINTGFGPMAQFKVDDDKLNELQYNLIRSHSSGAGAVLREEYVRAILVARLNNFLQANSGISVGVIEKIVEFLNKGDIDRLNKTLVI